MDEYSQEDYLVDLIHREFISYQYRVQPLVDKLAAIQSMRQPPPVAFQMHDAPEDIKEQINRSEL